MLANRTSRWSIGAALLCAAILAASWFLLISPRRADATDLQEKTDQANSQASDLQVQIAQLKAEFADLPARRIELAAIKSELPAQTGIPTLIRDLRTTADKSGMEMKSLTPGTPAVVAAPGAAPQAVAGAGSLVSVPITLAVEGDYFEASLYLKNLQTKMNRAFLVTGLDATAATLPVTASPTVVATTAPTATPTATATSTPAPTPTPTVGATTAPEPDLSYLTLSVSASVFVLLDGAVTLDDVSAQVKAAATAATGTTGAVGGSSISN